ncbi:MAG: acetyl-CoA C-acetyltransferase, partial [Pseudomonadota bacterium]
MTNPVVIAAARRTPIGSFQGQFARLSAHQLGSAAIGAVVQDGPVDADQVSEVIMGCVLPAGQGQAPARQAALGAELPLQVGCTTINKVCGSGLKAVMQAHDALLAGSAEVVVAGGMESM